MQLETMVTQSYTPKDHYHQMFIPVEILHWNYSGNGNTAFESVVSRKFWSWTLAISSLFSSDLDKFKLGTQIKSLKDVVDKKQVGIKETIQIISSWNASRKLLVSEVLKCTNVVCERSRSTLCRVKTYLWSSMIQEPVNSCLTVTTYKR